MEKWDFKNFGFFLFDFVLLQRLPIDGGFGFRRSRSEKTLGRAGRDAKSVRRLTLIQIL